MPVTTGYTSLSFQDEFDSLGDFFVPIGGIGLRTFVSDNVSMDFGLGFRNGSEEEEDDNGTTVTESEMTLGFTGGVNYHFNALYSVSPYLGGSLQLGYGSKTNETESENSSSETTRSGFTIGINAHIGFDWYFTAGMAIGGRYTLGFYSLPDPTVERKVGDDVTETDGKSRSFIGTGIGSFVLTVHI